MKFIHAADLHIESPYQGISRLNSELGSALTELGKKSYANLIDLCISEKVDFLLLAGDSFETATGSLGAMYGFFEGLRRLEQNNIKVYIICGNHDPLGDWSKTFKLPENATLFGSENVTFELFRKNGAPVASIYGISYEKREEWRPLAKEFERKDSAPFSIALLHGTLSGRHAHIPYCPFDLSMLREADIDYWALGHIHKHEVLSEANPLAVYPGNLQGRHFNETGRKGCYMVEVDEKNITSKKFMPLSELIFNYHSTDISGIEGESELFTHLGELKYEYLKNESECFMLRIELTGRTGIFEKLSDHDQLNNLIEEINRENKYKGRFVFVDKIINKTQPQIDLEERKRSSDLIADLINRFESYESDPEKLRALRDKIFAEIKSARAGKFAEKPEEDQELKEILENAKWKCIGGLIPGKEQD